jgi:thiopurine S-methyltransferase
LQPEFWHERWRSGQIGFHQSLVDGNLREHWTDLSLARDSRTFVPLCGKSLDLLWLRDRGHHVVGVELSAVALTSFCMEQGIPARRRVIDDFDIYETAQLQLFCGNVFSLTPELLGPVTAVYDRAALISWTPALREAYVQHMTVLTSPGTQTFVVTVEYSQTQMTGPPFSVTAGDVNRLYGHQHAIQLLARQDILASEPRLRSRGLTQLQEVCYLLTRL